MPKADVSELEGCTLGVVWLLAPTTAYQIRRRFAASGSAWWSGSAGAIYPLLHRLRSAGLVRSEARPTGRRHAEVYHLTESGARALRSWIWARQRAGDATDFDPMRVRVRFLACLPPAERSRFVRTSLETLDQLTAKIERDCRASRADGDTFRYLTGRAALHAARARRRWLMEVDRALASGEPTAPHRGSPASRLATAPPPPR